MPNTERHCPECNERIVGRVDKRFCSDHCRSAHHNRFLQEKHRLVRSTNRILRKNRSLLDQFRSRGVAEIDLEYLTDLGFRQGYVTSIYANDQGEVIYCCYDQAFRKINGSKICLEEKKFKGWI